VSGRQIFPDLYDIDGTSEGAGNWCLMAAGS
jgi:immune inhibitor A